MKNIGDNIFELEPEDAALPTRDESAHKGNFGRVLIIAGSVGFTGAPAFAARAAVRSGAGLVFLAVPQEIWAVEAVKNDEAMVLPLSPSLPEALETLAPHVAKADAVVLGPGLGLSAWARELVYAVLESCRAPLVLDADGITAVSRHIDRLDKLSCPAILTPHEGEFARLTDALARKPREEAAREFAEAHGVTVVLKGHRTVTAQPDGVCYVNPTGNPGMAKGGSGDVLAGMIAAFLGQKIPGAVWKAVYLHGAAGDLCAEAENQLAMTPSDMIGYLRFFMR